MSILKKYGGYLIAASVVLIFILLAVLASFSSTRVNIWVDEQPEPISLSISSSLPSKILAQAGVEFSEGDSFLVNGLKVAMDKPIENLDQVLIQIRHSHIIEVNVDGQSMTFSSSAQTLGEALWDNNIILNASDILNPPVNTPLDRDLNVTLQRSQVYYIMENSLEKEILSSATTVGQALASAGYSLQNQDYSIPGENEPLPVDRIIKIVRVREEIQIQSTTMPFDTEFVDDPQMDLDTKKLVQAGEYGISMARERVRFEDGRETSRTIESEWIARTPVTQQYAYGTKYSIQTTSTADGTIEYYRAASVWITSYKDTGSPTASGKWPTKGDVAVNPTWYKYMKGSRIYIPGYGIGTVVDVCPGCVGKPWIDVFLPTAEYVGWHTTQTVYFLTPVPANILWMLE